MYAYMHIYNMASLMLAFQLYSSCRAGVCPGHCHHSLIPASERTEGMLFLHPLLSVKPMSSLADPIRLSMALARDGMGGEKASGAVRILPFHPMAKALVLMGFGAGLFSGAGAEQVKGSRIFFFFPF